MNDFQNTMLDIAEYFKRCKANAQPGSSAERRFGIYVNAATEAAQMAKRGADDERPESDSSDMRKA